MKSARCAFGLEIRTDGIQIRDAIFNCSITRYIRISRFNERRIRIESKTIFSIVIIFKSNCRVTEGKVDIVGKRVDPKYLKSFQSLLRTRSTTPTLSLRHREKKEKIFSTEAWNYRNRGMTVRVDPVGVQICKVAVSRRNELVQTAKGSVARPRRSGLSSV